MKYFKNVPRHIPSNYMMGQNENQLNVSLRIFMHKIWKGERREFKKNNNNKEKLSA